MGPTMTVLSVGVAPLLSNAADHLDAPALGGTVVGGVISPHSEHGDRDINDVYVFQAPDKPDNTVLVMTVNPAINLFGGMFGTNVRYAFNIDTNGDNVQDVAYVATLQSPASHQPPVLRHSASTRARSPSTSPDPARRSPRARPAC